jgi:hypothetical protein
MKSHDVPNVINAALNAGKESRVPFRTILMASWLYLDPGDIRV